MPLRVKCPTGHKLIVPDDRAGRLLRCPRCSEAFVVEGGRGVGELGIGSPEPGGAERESVSATAVDMVLAALSTAKEATQLVSAERKGNEAPPPPRPSKPKSRAIVARPAPEPPIEAPLTEAEPIRIRVDPPTPTPPQMTGAPIAPFELAPTEAERVAVPEPERVVTPAPEPAAPPEQALTPEPPPPATSTEPPPPAVAAADLEPPNEPVALPAAAAPVEATSLAPPVSSEEAWPQHRTELHDPPLAPPDIELSVEPEAVPPLMEAPVAVRQAMTADPHWLPAVYLLAGSMVLAAVFGMIPAVWDVVDYWRFADSQFVARWALVLIGLGIVQIAYAVYLVQLPDWTSVWVVTLYALALAGLYAMVLGLVFISRDDGAVVRALQLSDKLASGQALLWCLCMVSICVILAFFAGRLSVQWHRAETLLRRAGL